MDVNRTIAVYEKIGNQLIKEIDINCISVDVLIKIITTDEGDPDLYKVYKITKPQYQKLVEIIPELTNVDFKNTDIFYECYQK